MMEGVKLLGVQWFYQRRGRWEPFGELENIELEDAVLNVRDCVEFGAGRYPAVISERIQHNYDAGSTREILRGTWFFQRSDGTLCPYAEDVAAAIEAEFPRHNGQAQSTQWKAIGVPVDPQRSVYRAMEVGEYAQVHHDTHTVRWATNVYVQGQMPMKTVTPLSEAQQKANDALTLATVGEEKNTQNVVESKASAVQEDMSYRLIQWWCQRSGAWERFSDADCGALENAYHPPRHAQVAVCGGTAEVDIISQTERSREGAVHPVLRCKQCQYCLYMYLNIHLHIKISI
jgi:hypothetical protein